MSQTRAKQAAKTNSTLRARSESQGLVGKIVLPLLLIFFVGSGCAALMYEIVWFQMLRLVIGSSTVSLAVLLGTFMGGMCLGSLLLPRLVGSQHHPLRVYALLEIAIGALALVLFWLIPLVGHLYTDMLGHGLASILFRGLVCIVCLLPPTMLMGATLPAIARWVETTPRGVSRLGFFYGANIAGAVFGCLLAGFYLLRLYDSLVTTLIAVSINFIVGGLAIALSIHSRHKAIDDTAPQGDAEQRASKQQREEVPASAPYAWTIYLAIALSGLTALGAEVVWTRLLSLLLGATTYTFSIILAVFLVGLGIGSSAGAALSKRIPSPRIGLAICQAALAAAIAWAAYMISGSLPWWPIDPVLAVSSWSSFQLDILRCAWAMLPASILWGASFPLALACVAAPGQDSGRLVGGVYAANTLGAIAGALGFSMGVIGEFGTQTGQQLMIWLTAGSAALVLAPPVFRAIAESLAIILAPEVAKENDDAQTHRTLRHFSVVGLLAAAIGLSGFLHDGVPEVPKGLIAYGRNMAADGYYREGLLEYLAAYEGMNASIAISELRDEFGKTRNFHVSGKIVASNNPPDMRLQMMLGHIPALLHPNPKKVLIVGCGAGVTSGTFLLHPSVEEIVICEIETLIPSVANQWFGKENNRFLDDPRVKIINDDARHYIATTDETFDIITSDPIHPWVKGAAALYSTEYHELCKRRLNPNGIITLWVPLYESNKQAVKSELASFMQVFPDGTIWDNDDAGEGYDVVAMSGIKQINLDSLQRRSMELKARARAAGALDPVDIINRRYDLPTDASIMVSAFIGRGVDLKPWLDDAQINTDRNLRLQYLAGESFNEQTGKQTHDEMTRYTRFPEGFFTGSNAAELDQLRQTIKPFFGQ
ncbi:MAG: fused MFS/spermidine synthase [Pirellulales bacterium]|nr:fused MFS/spermidine synthase [Pirellulales bacterium]